VTPSRERSSPFRGQPKVGGEPSRPTKYCREKGNSELEGWSVKGVARSSLELALDSQKERKSLESKGGERARGFYVLIDSRDRHVILR